MYLHMYICFYKYCMLLFEYPVLPSHTSWTCIIDLSCLTFASSFFFLTFITAGKSQVFKLFIVFSNILQQLCPILKALLPLWTRAVGNEGWVSTCVFIRTIQTSSSNNDAKSRKCGNSITSDQFSPTCKQNDKNRCSSDGINLVWVQMDLVPTSRCVIRQCLHEQDQLDFSCQTF